MYIYNSCLQPTDMAPSLLPPPPLKSQLSSSPPLPPATQPFLLDGFKCDLRVYVLVTSCNPLRIFVYKDGLVCNKYSIIIHSSC